MKINEKGISKITGILIAVVALLVIANVATVAYFYAKKENAKKIVAAPIIIASSSQEFTQATSSDEIATSIEKTALIDNIDEEIEVDWQVNSQATTTLEKFLPQVDFKKLGEGNFENIAVVYIGRVKDGFYKDKDLYRIEVAELGTTYFRVIKDGDKIVVLNNYSGSVRGYGFSGVFYENSKLTIKDFEPPMEISIPNSDSKLIKSSNKNEPMFTADLSDLKTFFKYNNWQVYKNTPSGCFVVKAKDGTDRNYYFNFLQQSLNYSENDGDPYYSFPLLKGIKWNNGSVSKDDYSVARRSCFYGCYNYADIKQNELILAGTVNNQLVYELKNPKNNEENSEQFFYLEFDKTRITYADYLKSHPVIYWRDPFGDYIALRNTKFDQFSMVECGKPVIYLYPQKTTDVSVQVAPTGGFTITEPAYNNGWKVKATPDSELYNYADKQTYPYLFWEGKAYNYQIPNAGFVVKKEEVEKFLIEKLAKLGLIQKEYDEFIEFWLPKMQAKPYYFVTFVPQSDFDKIAPLSVNPKPDTIIRVFMDFQGLDNVVRVPEQKIVTPIRKGFTVVEWGGALHN